MTTDFNHNDYLLKLEQAGILNGRIEQIIIASLEKTKIDKLTNQYLSFNQRLLDLDQFCRERQIKFDFSKYFKNIDDLNKAKIDKIDFEIHQLETSQKQERKKKRTAKKRQNSSAKNRERLDKSQSKNKNLPAISVGKSIRTIPGGLPESGK